MISGVYIDGNKDIEDAVFVREQVFVNEQHIPNNLVFDDFDNEAIHVIVYEDKKPVGTGRLVFDNGIYLIGRIAVLTDKRGNNYGDLVVKMLIQKAFDMGAEYIEVHSQIKAVMFYKKIGFIESSEIYKEAGIDHITMKLQKGKMIKKCNCK